MGAFTRTRAESAEGLERVYALFPRVKERKSQIAGYLSGGEQQMVAIGRALMGRPRVLHARRAVARARAADRRDASSR